MGALYAIENEDLRVTVSDMGAELQEIVWKRSGEQVLWHGDPAVWKGRAPWLFPIIGRLKDDYYTFRGRRCDMAMHGFARKAVFDAERTGDDALRFTLRESPETLAVYPWRFELSISYRLNGLRLGIDCAVRNRDEKDMFFSLGAHPGFLCQAGDRLRFGDLDELICRRLTADGHLLRLAGEPVALESHMLTLQAALFEDDAMIFEKPAATDITLVRAQGASVRFSFDAVPWLGVWSKPVGGGLRYICLEPWLGVDDRVDTDHDIEHKEAIQSLAPGGEASFSLAIEPV